MKREPKVPLVMQEEMGYQESKEIEVKTAMKGYQVNFKTLEILDFFLSLNFIFL